MKSSKNISTDTLSALGITQWHLRHNDEPATESEPVAIASQTLDNLAQSVANCQACSLHQGRTHTVFGTGNPDAEIMLIGEAPGLNEDKQGQPFVGEAGQLLTKMLAAIQLTRDEVYIANVLKCRPPNNRDPLETEVATCTNYLNQQIELIQPKLLVALGRVAAHYLLNCKASLESLRGKTHTYAETEIPLVATYHPAYLLRNPGEKRKSYQDLLFIQQLVSS